MRDATYETEIINGFTYVIDAAGRRFQVPSGGKDGDAEGDAEEEDAGATGDAGGTGEDDETAGDSAKDASVDDSDETEGGRDADDTGGKPSTKGLEKRLKALAAAKREYKELGSPQELRAMKARIAEYDRYERELDAEDQRKRDEAARKAGQPTVADQNAALDRMLNQRFGAGSVEDFQSFRETRQMEVQRHTKEGLDHLRTLLTTHNMKSDDKTVANYERHMGTELLSDISLRARFRDPVTQKDALTEAFNRVRSDLIDPALAAVGATKLAAAARRRATAPSSSGTVSAPHYNEKELKPPKNATPEQRAKFWDKAIEDAITEQNEYDALGNA
jgi:hypothetical protein